MYGNFFWVAPICEKDGKDGCSHCGVDSHAVYRVAEENFLKESFAIEMTCNFCLFEDTLYFDSPEHYLQFVRIFTEDQPVMASN